MHVDQSPSYTKKNVFACLIDIKNYEAHLHHLITNIPNTPAFKYLKIRIPLYLIQFYLTTTFLLLTRLTFSICLLRHPTQKHELKIKIYIKILLINVKNGLII